MKGLAFLEAAVLRADDPTTPEFLAAGIVVRFAIGALRGSMPTWSGLHHAQEMIDAVEDEGAANLLRAIGDTMWAVDDNENFGVVTSLVCSRLAAYGDSLHSRGFYPQAIDIFDLLIWAPVCDLDLRMQAMLARGFACRVSQRFDDAELSYLQLRVKAHEHRAEHMRLEAELGLARIVAQRGNIADFQQMLDRLIPQAENFGNPAILEKVYVDRAFAAGSRHRYVEALHYSYLALEGMKNATRRARTLVNIGAALRELGEHVAAVAVSDHGMEIAADSETRLAHIFTRYHLAIDVEDWTTVKLTRALLRPLRSTPAHRVSYLEAVAREYATRAKWQLAQRALEQMISIASAAQLSEYSERGEIALADVGIGVVPARYTFRPTPPSSKAKKKAVTKLASAVTAFCAASK
jgi:tetratricopeptide (TPR) repeat protein